MGRQRGFTIIEVILFLAISAMLFVIALRYTSSSIENTRFIDAGNQLTEFIRSQYGSVKNASVTRPAGGVDECNTGVSGQSNCTVLGKLLYFAADNTTIQSMTVVGTINVTQAADDRTALMAAKPKVLSSSGSVVIDETFSLPWAMVMSTKQFMPVSGVAASFNTLYILRSPVSERVYMGVGSVTVGDPTQATMFNGDNPAAPAIGAVFEGPNPNVDRPTLICTRGSTADDQRNAVTLTGGSGTGNIKRQVVAAEANVLGMPCS